MGQAMAAILSLPNTALVGVARLNWSAFLAAQPKAGGHFGRDFGVFLGGIWAEDSREKHHEDFWTLDFPRLLLCSFW